MHHRKPPRAETPIERIYREETGRQMPAIYQTYPASQANRQTQAPLESACTTTKICGRFEGLASESSPADLHNKKGVLADAVYLQGEQHAIV